MRKAQSSGKSSVALLQKERLAPGLTDQQLLDIYHKMLMARTLSTMMSVLHKQGRAGFVVSGDGHEAAQVGSAYALRPGEDFFLPYYRDIGVVLVAGMTPLDILLGAFARAADPSSGGRQMTCHFSQPRLKIVSGSSPVGTQIPHAVGIALAAKLRREETVAVVYFGDGAASKGDFHEGLNFAGVHRLPVIFFCENNGLAISVPAEKQAPIANLAERAAGYGFPGYTVDGMDVLEVYRVTREAVEQARAGHGPTLIEAKVYRYGSHTSNDDDRRYRSREEVEEARRSDPVRRYQETLLEWGLLTPEKDAEFQSTIRQEVEQAVQAAEASPLPNPEDALLHVYSA